MADQARPLLDGIDDRLLAMTTEGQPLEVIRQYYVQKTGEDIPPDFGNTFPCCYVELLGISGETASIPACMTRKECTMQFWVFTGKGSDVEDPTAAELIDLIEDVFHQHQLGLSNILVHFVEKNYDPPTEFPFSEWVQGSASLTYAYGYTDTRSL